MKNLFYLNLLIILFFAGCAEEKSPLINDLEINNLKGEVKQVTFTSYNTTRVSHFNKEGYETSNRTSYDKIESIDTYNYSAPGIIGTSVLVYHGLPATVREWKYKFDKEGKPLSGVGINEKDTITTIYRYGKDGVQISREYNMTHRIVTLKFLNRKLISKCQTFDKITHRIEEYTYDEEGHNPISEKLIFQTLSGEGNKTVLFTYKIIRTDDNGNWIERRVHVSAPATPDSPSDYTETRKIEYH